MLEDGEKNLCIQKRKDVFGKNSGHEYFLEKLKLKVSYIFVCLSM